MIDPKLTELLTSGEQVDALESAIRSLTGGEDAIDAATAAVIALRDDATALSV